MIIKMIFKKISENSLSFLKRRKKLVYFVLGFLFLFFFIFHYSHYPVLKFADKTADNIENRFGIDVRLDLGRNIDRVYRIFDLGEILRIKTNLYDGTIPIYDLKLSENDLNHFNEISNIFVKQGYKEDVLNTWRNVKLSYNGKNYDVKLKLHGDGENHWKYKEKSYKIKSSKESVNGLERFNLILFEDRLLYPTIDILVSNYLGLYNVRNDIVVLRINGVNQGLYVLQESLEIPLLENNQCSSCTIIKRTNDYWIDHFNNGANGIMPLTYSVHISDFDYDISSVDTLKTSLNEQELFFKINVLFKTIEEGDYEQLLEFFDLDQLSSFEAMRRITGDTHDSVGDNLKLIYSASTGKFYPVPLSEGIGKLKLRKGGVENYMNNIKAWDGDAQIKLFYWLNKNDKLRQETNKKIYDFIINDKEIFLKEQEEIFKKYTPYAMAYKMKTRSPIFIKFLLDNSKSILRENINILENNLKYAKMYFNVIKRNNQVEIEIIPDSISQLKFERMNLVLGKEYLGSVTLKLKDEKGGLILGEKHSISDNIIDLMSVLHDIPFAAGLDDDLYPQKRVYTLEVLFDDNINLLDLDISIVNDITGQFLSEEDIYFNIAKGDNYYPKGKELNFEEFKREYPSFNWQFNNRELTLKSGVYKITKDLIIPQFSRFTIESDTIILIAENKSLVSYSPLNIQGTSSNKVVVTALDKNKPFGTFGVIGEDGFECLVEGLDLSYGNERFIEGVYFSGALSIHNCDLTTVLNSKIHDNQADDGMIIKYSEVFLSNNEFYDNFADQVDLDFTTGIVKENKFFLDQVKDSNGDGLDLSGSTIVVTDNLFQGFVDKGVSIGERTEIVLYGNKFINNHLGVAVKDSSQGFFIKNIFEKNSVAMNSYQKKQLFDGGIVYESVNDYLENEQIYVGDKKSKRFLLDLKSEGLALVDKLIKNREINLLFKFLNQRAEISVKN